MSSHNEILYSGSLATIGSFDCPVTAPDFADTGPATDYLLAFPLTAVRICHRGQRTPIVADPNVVTIYNKGQEYERGSLSDYGDRCDWLAFAPPIITEALADIGVRHAGDPDRLFTVSHGMSPPAAYALLRRLTLYLRRDTSPDPLTVEEAALNIFHAVLANAYEPVLPHAGAIRSATQARHRKLVGQVCEILATRYPESLSLASLTGELNTSAYHLCRIFRQQTGMTVHRYLTQLRLRNALLPLTETDTDLASLSGAMGFADHSHFSRYFRQSFAVTPSRFRRLLRSPQPLSIVC